MIHLLLNLVKALVLAVIGLILWQLVSYMWMGDSSRIDTIFRILPANSNTVHFACPDAETLRHLSNDDTAYLKSELERRYEQNYPDQAKIPDKYIQYQEVGSGRNKQKQRLFTCGVEFRYRVVDAAMMYFEAEYQVYGSTQRQPTSYRREYFWILGRWMERE